MGWKWLTVCSWILLLELAISYTCLTHFYSLLSHFRNRELFPTSFLFPSYFTTISLPKWYRSEINGLYHPLWDQRIHLRTVVVIALGSLEQSLQKILTFPLFSQYTDIQPVSQYTYIQPVSQYTDIQPVSQYTYIQPVSQYTCRY